MKIFTDDKKIIFLFQDHFFHLGAWKCFDGFLMLCSTTYFECVLMSSEKELRLEKKEKHHDLFLKLHL